MLSAETVERLAGHQVCAAVSGGKDSAAMSLWLTEQGITHSRVFADTGWEAPETYAYLDVWALSGRHADHGSWRVSMRLRPRDIDALEAALHTHGSLADLAPDTERTLALEALTALTGSTGNLVFLARRAVTRDKNLSAMVATLEAEYMKLSRENDSRNERHVALLEEMIRGVSEGDGSVPKVLEALEARAANTVLMAAIKRIKGEGC